MNLPPPRYRVIILADRGQSLGGDHVPRGANARGPADRREQLGDVPLGPAGGLAHRFRGDAADRRDAPRLLPELDPRLSKTADRVLRRRGVRVRTGQSVTKALDGYVRLSTGEKVPTRSLIWCVGVRAEPLVDGLDLKTEPGTAGGR